MKHGTARDPPRTSTTAGNKIIVKNYSGTCKSQSDATCGFIEKTPRAPRPLLQPRPHPKGVVRRGRLHQASSLLRHAVADLSLSPHHLPKNRNRLRGFPRLGPPRRVVLDDDRALGRQMPRHGHLVPRSGVHAGQHQRLPVLRPPHVGEGGRRGRRRLRALGWGGGGSGGACGGRDRGRSGLATDEEVLLLGAAAVAVHDQSEAGGVVVDQVHDGRRLHPSRLGGGRKEGMMQGDGGRPDRGGGREG